MRGTSRITVGYAEWALLAILWVGTALAAEPNAAVAPTAGDDAGNVLIVSRADDAESADGLTLRFALERAARDPNVNIIQFDRSVFRAQAVRIRIDRPLSYAPMTSTGGHDRVDAPTTGLTIETEPGADAVLIVRQARLTLERLTLAGGEGRALMLTDCPDVQLVECRFIHSDGAGIAAFGRGQVSLRGGELRDNHLHGIVLHGDTAASVTGTAICRNAEAGLAAFERSRATIHECMFDANGQWGILVADDGAVQVANTRVQQSGFAQIDASRRGRIKLTGCTLTQGSRFGMIAAGDAQVWMTDGSIVEHQSRGIELQDRAQAQIRSCRIERSGDFGVVLFGETAIDVQGGAIRRNHGHGLAIRDDAQADVWDCAFEGNRYSGAGAPDAGDGGRLRLRRCTFRSNRLRPVFRGPMHLDPPVPTVVRIAGDTVTVRTAPRAIVDLYADRVGEAARYLRSVTADEAGLMTLSVEAVPVGEVITAAATTPDGHTSEFNVVAGPIDRDILAALLARTGPLSDTRESLADNASIHRWRSGSQVVFDFRGACPPHVECYVQQFTADLRGLIGETIRVEARFGRGAPLPETASVVPVQYAANPVGGLRGAAGTTFTRWDHTGHLTGPIRILLTEPAAGQTTCPRVTIHEMCHALGLYHARVGLLSRMQGIPEPSPESRNDFSPTLTFYDALALQILYDRRLSGHATIADLTQLALLPKGSLGTEDTVVARKDPGADTDPSASEMGTFSSPPASRP